MASVRANAVLIQSNGGELNIQGAEEGTDIQVYDMAGRSVGSARAAAGTTAISTTLSSGEVGIVKIGRQGREGGDEMTLFCKYLNSE